MICGLGSIVHINNYWRCFSLIPLITYEYISMTYCIACNGWHILHYIINIIYSLLQSKGEMQQQSLEAWGADRTAGSDPSMVITSYINIGHSIIIIYV